MGDNLIKSVTQLNDRCFIVRIDDRVSQDSARECQRILESKFTVDPTPISYSIWLLDVGWVKTHDDYVLAFTNKAIAEATFKSTNWPSAAVVKPIYPGGYPVPYAEIEYLDKSNPSAAMQVAFDMVREEFHTKDKR